MKKQKAISVILLIFICCVAYKYSMPVSNAKTDIFLRNIEALANDDETGGEKIYRYDVFLSQECLIYVGGAYAKGKKVNCYNGTDHPVCVDCQL